MSLTVEHGSKLRPKAAFLDRDGVINHDHGYVCNIAQFDLIDGVIEACQKLQLAGYDLVIVTNQSGIGRGYYTSSQFETLHHWLNVFLSNHKVKISGTYFCPHHLDAKLDAFRMACDCRKPEPGMLIQAQNELDIDLSRSVLFGDKESDLLAGQAVGLKTLGKIGTPSALAHIQCDSLIEGVEQLLGC